MKKLNEVQEAFETLYDNHHDEMMTVVGEYVYDDMNTYDNIARSVLRAIQFCETDEQLEIADRMFTAIFGWTLDTFMIDVMKEVHEREEYENEYYTPSSTYGDYSPSNPWDAPGMSISDFI